MSIDRSPFKPKRQKRVFSFDAPQAKEVLLAGDFNDWKAEKHPLKKNNDGLWQKSTFLLPGRYEYKFLVDGTWKVDPENTQVCMNQFGSQNNVFTISSK